MAGLNELGSNQINSLKSPNEFESNNNSTVEALVLGWLVNEGYSRTFSKIPAGVVFKDGSVGSLEARARNSESGIIILFIYLFYLVFRFDGDGERRTNERRSYAGSK